MDGTMIIDLIGTAATVIATAFAAYALFQTKNTQKKSLIRERKQATIDAYYILQTDVMDKLASFSKDEIRQTVEAEEEEFRKVYADYRVLSARCEHFAVGVYEEIYDLDTVDKLSGEHLYWLYHKVEPVILRARQGHKNGKKFYATFERLAKELGQRHGVCTGR